MDVWKIQFLGAPCAFRGGLQAHLRSRETWGVLASLILPSVHRDVSPGVIARETLSERFWSSTEPADPRAHLRQCLTSLRAAFGEECLIANRDEVRIASGWCTTDVDIAFGAYRKGLAATTLEERLHWLTLAEEEIGGEFFEGWMPDNEDAQIWMIHLRADIRSHVVSLLRSEELV